MKRKLLFFLLSLFICVFSSTSALAGSLLGVLFEKLVEAYSEYEYTITFRGVPWGSTYDETVSALGETVPLYSPSTYSDWYSVSDYLTDASPTYSGVLGCTCFASDVVPVAGYEADSTTLYFVFTVDDDRKLSKDYDHAALVYAEYMLSFVDGVDEAYDDLTTKLTALYGEPTTGKRMTIFYESYPYCIWEASDGSFVQLSEHISQHSDVKDKIYIKYGFSGADDLAKAAEDIIALGNVDGL